MFICYRRSSLSLADPMVKYIVFLYLKILIENLNRPNTVRVRITLHCIFIKNLNYMLR